MNMIDASIKFKDFSQTWYSKHSIGVSYTHQRNLKCMIKHLNNSLGDLKLQDIKSYHIDDMISQLAQKNPNTKKPSSRKLLKEIVQTANRVFEMALDYDLINKNPAKNKGREIPKNAPTKIIKAISKEEQELILETSHRCQIPALLMMLTGLRVSEVLALEWNDIDFKNKIIYVRKHVVHVSTNKYEIRSGTKNGKSRCVTVPDNLCSFLYLKKADSKSSLIFSKTDGNLNTPSSWKSAWRGYINSLNWESYKKNLGEKENISKFDPKGYPKTIKIHPHQLRHTYATLLYFAKVDPLTASKLLGHSTVQLTLDTYTHLDNEYKKLDISNFNDYLSSDLCNL